MSNIYNINGDAIQSAYDVRGNPLTQCYDINGNPLMSSIVFADSTTVTDIYISTINAYPQGGCMDDEGNLCACLLTTSQFIKHNIATGDDTLYSFTPDAYGHANGMTYNPNTQRFYVAPALTEGQLFVFNKSFELVDTLYIRDENGNLINCWNVAYNCDTNKFITIIPVRINDNLFGKIITYDSNFNYLYHTLFGLDSWPDTRQDIETDGMYIYCVTYNPNSINVVDFQGNFIKRISNTGFSGEPENLCYDWSGNYYMSGKASRFVIRKVGFIEQT